MTKTINPNPPLSENKNVTELRGGMHKKGIKFETKVTGDETGVTIEDKTSYITPNICSVCGKPFTLDGTHSGGPLCECLKKREHDKNMQFKTTEALGELQGGMHNKTRCQKCGKLYSWLAIDSAVDPERCTCPTTPMPGLFSPQSWTCPVCGAGLSPYTSRCPCVPNPFKVTCDGPEVTVTPTDGSFVGSGPSHSDPDMYYIGKIPTPLKGTWMLTDYDLKEITGRGLVLIPHNNLEMLEKAQVGNSVVDINLRNVYIIRGIEQESNSNKKAFVVTKVPDEDYLPTKKEPTFNEQNEGPNFTLTDYKMISGTGTGLILVADPIVNEVQNLHVGHFVYTKDTDRWYKVKGVGRGGGSNTIGIVVTQVKGPRNDD
ncbi:hypothetical protein LCGC14_0245670 [marine sediment metagenome]|uniref:Uncharacterized protein n=1 Tax=marine sediment metagenome TaxID=412755 RepID=A0A0F9WR17_9ZZZZ